MIMRLFYQKCSYFTLVQSCQSGGDDGIRIVRHYCLILAFFTKKAKHLTRV